MKKYWGGELVNEYRYTMQLKEVNTNERSNTEDEDPLYIYKLDMKIFLLLFN